MIKYTREMITKLENVPSFYCETYEDVFYYLSAKGIVNCHYETFILHKNKYKSLDINAILYKEDSEKTLEDFAIEFYSLMEQFKATSLTPIKIKAYTAAMSDDTGNTAIKIWQLANKNKPQQIEVKADESILDMFRNGKINVSSDDVEL